MKTDELKSGRRLPMTPAAVMALLAVAQLTGCAETDLDGLQSWIKAERARHLFPASAAGTDVAPAELQAQVLKPQRPGVEPFSRLRLLTTAPVDAVTAAPKTALQASSASASNRLAPPLEASPLAGMRLVGSLQRGGQPLALLRVHGLIYAVRVGDRIGQDQGRVTAITLTGLLLRESAPGPTGQPTERVVSLALVSEP